MVRAAIVRQCRPVGRAAGALCGARRAGGAEISGVAAEVVRVSGAFSSLALLLRGEGRGEGCLREAAPHPALCADLSPQERGEVTQEALRAQNATSPASLPP